MEVGVSARGELCKSSGLLMVLARAIPGMKLHKNGCLERQTRKLRTDLKSVSLVDGVVTLLNVGIPLSQSRRAERRVLASHVNFIQVNGKTRMRGDCELSVRATQNAGKRTFE